MVAEQPSNFRHHSRESSEADGATEKAAACVERKLQKSRQSNRQGGRQSVAIFHRSDEATKRATKKAGDEAERKQQSDFISLLKATRQSKEQTTKRETKRRPYEKATKRLHFKATETAASPLERK
jgi:hypothetical protein